MYPFALRTFLLGFLVVAGCDSVSNPDLAGSGPTSLPTLATPGASSSLMADEITLNGHRLRFLGATVAGGATTFSYQLTGIDPGPNLDWFFLENACGVSPQATLPANAVREETVGGVRGLRWSASLPQGQPRTYAYTFAGTLPVRIARATVSRGGVQATAWLPGPCGGAYVRGSVFGDADASATRSATELGIGSVLVEAYAGPTLAGAARTLADGRFEMLLPSGAYTLRVPTAGADAFNATLYGSYVPAGGVAPAERALSLAADLDGQDFGFSPNRQKIVADLSPGGAYQTRAQDVQFWQGAIRNASRGRATTDPYGGTLTPAEVTRYLAAIFSTPGEAAGSYYLLPDPYVQTGTDPLAAATEALSKPARTDLDKVRRNLFAMELNLMRGWGSPSRAYDDLLMSYLEEWVRAGGPVTTASAARASLSAEPTLSAAAVGGGGGGTVEELRMTTAYLGGGGGGTVED